MTALLLARAQVTALLLAPALVLAAGCEEERPPAPPPPADMMIRFDAGDAGMSDTDAQVDDLGAPDPDAGDAGSGSCRVEGEVLTLATDTIDRGVRLVDVAVSGSTFVVAWTDARSSVADVYVYAWPAAEASGAEHRVTDDFALTRDAQLAARTGGFVVGWVDNSLGRYEVLARPLDGAGVPTGTAQRVTNNMLREDALRLTGLGGSGAMAAWIESDGLGGAATARAVPLDAAGAAIGTAATADPRRPNALALSRLGVGAALAWNEDGDVYLQALSSAGALSGTAGVINTEHNASGDVALALDDDGGAVAFGVRVAGARAEVRLRTVSATGAVDGPEAILTPSPATGADPAVAAYAGGYVVAYRSADASSNAIRLAFATDMGEYAGSEDVAATTTAGGGPRVAVAADGRIVIAWLETDGTSAVVRAAKVICE